MNIFNDRSNAAARPSWRDYQNSLNRPPKHFIGRRSLLWGSIAVVILFSLYLGFSSPRASIAPSTVRVREPSHSNLLINKKDVRLLLQRTPLNDLLTDRLTLSFKNERFVVETSLDPILQSKLVDAMDQKNSRYVGVVVMQADSGKILALAGLNKVDPNANPCLQSIFPAASLFKIVTAAAAIDQDHFTCTTPVRFNGYAHTLYKRQLNNTRNAYTNTLTFAQSFAQSINPVFGKIGELRLGKQVLEKYGKGFGFNQPIDFELPVAPSHLALADSSYQWAEIACGFNNDTKISPLHAAMIVSAVLNRGRMIAPSLVERIVDGNGNVIYRSHATLEQRAMSPKASSTLAEMMQTVVRSGTARGFFKNLRRDPVLSKLSIGGKTGTIYNRAHDTRFDWFIGFAEDKNGPGRLIVAALVGHEEYIGTRSGAYARMAMTYYFRNQLARREARTGKTDS
jgi:peptidoglycan glycosyltransferase